MKASLLLVALALAIFGLAACGGDDDEDEETAVEAPTETAPAATGPGGTVNFSAPADGSFAYDQESAETRPGSVTINFDNPATLSHDVVVEDEGGTELGRTDLISESTTETTVELAAGTYTYFCDVPGHREGGMEGTLTVK